MGFQGYEVKLIYLTDNKLVGSYPDPAKLDYMIEYYNVSYYIFGYYYTYGKSRYKLETVEYVKNNLTNSSLLRLSKKIIANFYDEEDPKRKDEVYIYKVIN